MRTDICHNCKVYLYVCHCYLSGDPAQVAARQQAEDRAQRERDEYYSDPQNIDAYYWSN